MNNSKLIFGLIVFALLASTDLKAQDILLMRGSNDSLKVKVMEVGTTEVKYKLWPAEESSIVIAESKDKIRKIIFENGTVMKFSESDFADARNYADQKKMLVKIDLFSVLAGTTSVSFEKSIEPGRSWEAGIGMIGLGFNKETMGNNTGAFFRAGYKFINQPDYYMKGMRYSHIMKGGYIRPELMVHYFESKNSYSDMIYNNSTNSYDYFLVESKSRFTGMALMLNFGKQWVFNDAFVVDFFAGIGIGGGNTSEMNKTSTQVSYQTYINSGYYYSPSELNSPYGVGMAVNHNGGVGLAGQLGLKLGYMIGSK